MFTGDFAHSHAWYLTCPYTGQQFLPHFQMNTTRPSRVVVCPRLRASRFGGHALALRRRVDASGRTERTALVERQRAGKPLQHPFVAPARAAGRRPPWYRPIGTKEAIRVFGTPPCSH